MRSKSMSMKATSNCLRILGLYALMSNDEAKVPGPIDLLMAWFCLSSLLLPILELTPSIALPFCNIQYFCHTRKENFYGHHLQTKFLGPFRLLLYPLLSLQHVQQNQVTSPPETRSSDFRRNMFAA